MIDIRIVDELDCKYDFLCMNCDRQQRYTTNYMLLGNLTDKYFAIDIICSNCSYKDTYHYSSRNHIPTVSKKAILTIL